MQGNAVVEEKEEEMHDNGVPQVLPSEAPLPQPQPQQTSSSAAAAVKNGGVKGGGRASLTLLTLLPLLTFFKHWHCHLS